MARLLAHKSPYPAHLLDTVVAAFDWLDAGLLIAGVSGELLFANGAAARILDAQDGLFLDEDGKITTGLINGARVRSGIEDFPAILGAASKRGGLIVSVPRPSGRLPLTLTLRPTRLESYRSTDIEAGAVLVLIHDPERSANTGLSGLRELYGLTVTEARLAHLIMQGKTIEDCTGLLGIRRTTVKMHLRNLYGKTGVQRQSELVALGFTSFGCVSCAKPEQATVREMVLPGQQASSGGDRSGEREAC
jgi:DNA-binding CsgD family transcriptional regulator